LRSVASMDVSRCFESTASIDESRITSGGDMPPAVGLCRCALVICVVENPCQQWAFALLTATAAATRGADAPLVPQQRHVFCRLRPAVRGLFHLPISAVARRQYLL
jgi:hypothetical protein